MDGEFRGRTLGEAVSRSLRQDHINRNRRRSHSLGQIIRVQVS